MKNDHEIRHTIERLRTYPEGAVPSMVASITPSQRHAWEEVPMHRTRRTDLLVVGGGLSGIAAAVAASRRGLAVTLVEGTHMLGGQATAAGVSAFDITFFYDRLLNDHGLWSEVVRDVIRIYDSELSRPVNTGHYRNTSITPNVCVVERVLSEMLGREGVHVMRNTACTAAILEGDTLTGMHTSCGLIHADLIIDATEDGQVLGLAGFEYRVGNGFGNGRKTWGLDPLKAQVQDITYTATIREYPEGIPPELVLSSPPAGYERWRKGFSVFYPRSGRDPVKRKEGPLGFAGFRAAPDLVTQNMHTGFEWQAVTRTSLNHINDCPVPYSYLEDSSVRARYDGLAITRTLALMYYLQHDLDLQWSVCTDEGFADGPARVLNPHVQSEYADVVNHFPLIPYIRESRRLCGVTTMTGKSIARARSRTEARWRTDSIAVGTYHPDLHGGRDPGAFESDLGETLQDKPSSWREGPFPVPLGCLIPARGEGLLAAEKNISASRLAAAAVRVHPTVTAIGEAAGVLASIALRKKVRPRDVPAGAVQYELARGGACVTPLSIGGVAKEDANFADVSIAIARNRISYTVAREPAREPRINVDIDRARETGKVSRAFLAEWLLP